ELACGFQIVLDDQNAAMTSGHDPVLRDGRHQTIPFRGRTELPGGDRDNGAVRRSVPVVPAHIDPLPSIERPALAPAAVVIDSVDEGRADEGEAVEAMMAEEERVAMDERPAMPARTRKPRREGRAAGERRTGKARRHRRTGRKRRTRKAR